MGPSISIIRQKIIWIKERFTENNINFIVVFNGM